MPAAAMTSSASTVHLTIRFMSGPHRTAVSWAPVSKFQLVSGALGPLRTTVCCHDYGRAAGNQGLDLCQQRAARGGIHAGKCLIQQQQARARRPGPGEQHSAQLPIRELPQRARREPRQAEERERTPRRGPVRRARRIVEADARMASGLHDLRHRQMLRMIGLQMRSDETYAPFEYLERDAGLDSRPLDSSAGGHAMITIECPQERGLAGAVAPVDDPAFARADFERE